MTSRAVGSRFSGRLNSSRTASGMKCITQVVPTPRAHAASIMWVVTMAASISPLEAPSYSRFQLSSLSWQTRRAAGALKWEPVHLRSFSSPSGLVMTAMRWGWRLQAVGESCPARRIFSMISASRALPSNFRTE